MKTHLFVLSLLAFTNSFAQDKKTVDTSTLKEVVVSGFIPIDTKSTSLNIEPYSLKQINEKNPLNLSDALAKIPGISQMTTGNSISKPVIRGLYGNRILVLFSGLRFDNQQWQDEHGLGLSQIGIDRVEVIKGPASLLYGSDALGGVINIIEEKPTQEGKKLDFGVQAFSNTLGTLTNIGYSNRKGNKWKRLRIGFENHADYADGNGDRVLNSRNKGYYLKAGWGFEKAKWIQENSYNFSYNQFGFIMPDLNTVFTADDRFSRSMAGPHHNVILNMISSQNTFFLKKSTLKLNAGIQSNVRMEDEGGGQISLNMHLLSGLQNLKWEKKLGKRTSFVGNQQFTYENNTNYGGRIIIPDATFIEGNLSGYFKVKWDKVIVETGLGGNYKYIKTIATRHLNMPGDKIQPFANDRTTGNGMIGIVYNPNSWFSIKTNTATGFRSPNLAELSSNGLHEGVYRYEFGDPNLKSEQNLNTDLTLEIDRQQLFFSASVFNDVFNNYVYLSPTSNKFYGFPVFKYMQQDATLLGGECLLVLKPAFIKNIELKEGFTYTKGTLKDDGNLPFIPAARFTSAIRLEKKLRGKISRVFAEPEYIYVMKQDLPARFETGTGSYYLLNFTSGITVPAAKGNWQIGLTATNITNNIYTDHLSRLKYYGLYNQGINFVLSARKDIKW